jgi:hypothetical protein
MHPRWSIFIVVMAILGAVSVRIKDTTKDMCLKESQIGKGAYTVRKAVCDNSTSQNWIVDGDHIKNEKLQTHCLAIDRESVRDVKLINCEFTPSYDKKMNENATNVRKWRIEGSEVKNYRNECLYFFIAKVVFHSCEQNDMFKNKAYVV